MSDQLSKPLYGIFRFPVDADRAATLKNFRLGGNSVSPTVTTNAANLDASLGSTFIVANAANTTFTTTNLVDGQVIRLLFTNSSGGDVTNVFTSMSGSSVAVHTLKITLYTIFKVGPTVCFTQSAIT